MKEKKQMIRAFLDGEYSLTDKQKYSAMAVSVMAIHICLLAFFIAVKVLPLVIFNIGSIIAYVCMIKLVQHERYRIAFFLVYSEIFLHTIFAIFMVGWEVGFPYYNLALIPVSFYVAYTTPTFPRRLFTPMIMMVVNMVVTIVAKYSDTLYGPVERIDDTWKVLAMYTFNSTIAFVYMFIFSLFFVVEISRNQHVLQEKNSQLNELANYDPLTKLLNRRSIMPFYNEAVASGKDFCIVLSDIDDFKKVNDTYGHKCGDEILKHVADLCKKGLGEEDSICRWGGEEFLMVIQADLYDSIIKLERIRGAIEKNALEFEHSGVPVTMTFGIQKYVKGQTMEEAVSKADHFLYEGKMSGKNVVISQNGYRDVFC